MNHQLTSASSSNQTPGLGAKRLEPRDPFPSKASTSARRMMLLATVPFLAAGLISAPASADPVDREAPAPVVTSSQVLHQELPTEPPAGHDTRNLQWYDASPTLQATSGAPLEGQTEAVVTYDDDGVTGMIKNFSGQDVLVSSTLAKTKRTGQAILKAGDEMPYKLYAAGQLEFTKMKDGVAVPGATTKLWIKDPFVGRPSSSFTPAGHASPVTERSGWREGESHHEIWGDTKLWVKREADGWTIPSSDKYRELYGNPNTDGTSDWAIFTIHIDNL